MLSGLEFNKIKKIINDFGVERVFVILLMLFFVVSNLLIIKSGEDFFGYASEFDFGDTIGYIDNYGDRSLYDEDFYPPVALSFYKVCKQFRDLDMQNTGYSINYLLTIVGIICIVGIFALIERILNKNGKRNCARLAFALMLSGPMIFMIERGNILIIALLGTLFFCLYYDSEIKIERFLSCFSLALAANLKYYPALFGLLLVKKKRWRELILLIGFGVGLFILPAIIFRDSSIMSFFSNFTKVVNAVESEELSINGSFGLKYCAMYLLLNYTAISYKAASTIGSLVLLVVVMISMVVFFFTDSEDTQLIMLTMTMIFVPGVSYWYVQVLIMIPFVYFGFRINNILDLVKLVLYFYVFVFAYGSAKLFAFAYPGHNRGKLFFLWMSYIISYFIYEKKSYKQSIKAINNQ